MVAARPRAHNWTCAQSGEKLRPSASGGPVEAPAPGRLPPVAVRAADDALLGLREDGRPGERAADHLADVGSLAVGDVVELQDDRGRLAAVDARVGAAGHRS